MSIHATGEGAERYNYSVAAPQSEPTIVMAESDARCPACGGAGQAAGVQRTSRYDFAGGVPGILFHVLFLLLVAIGVLFFTYVAGYTALALWSAAATGVLAVWTFVLLRRGYRVEEQLWRRCERCGRTWSTRVTA